MIEGSNKKADAMSGTFCHTIQIQTKKNLKFCSPFVAHLNVGTVPTLYILNVGIRDMPYFVHSKCRDCPYIVHCKCRNCPYAECGVECVPKVVFRQRSSSVKGGFPSDVIFCQRSSSVKGCLPSTVILIFGF